MKTSTAVDVVIDVPSARVDRAFTYAVSDDVLALGERVRVPFNGRVVGAWVVSEPRRCDDDVRLKQVVQKEARGPRLDAAAVRLAYWLRRRYACTLREALLAVAPRASIRGSKPRYRFRKGAPVLALEGRPSVTATVRRLLDALAEKPFAAVTARKLLRLERQNMTLQSVIGELERLVQSGILERLETSVQRPALRRIRQGTPARASGSSEEIPRSPLLRPTAGQSEAIAQIAGVMLAGNAKVLLHGVTGSGKTFVYCELIQRLRRRGGRAIVLVPEISLTPQTARRFSAVFGSRVAVLHSGLSDGERAAVWSAAESGRLDVVVGARSAAFTPLPDLRLIVVDEEHEPSYKQDTAPRYDAAAVAAERMRQAHGSIILGSATPSLETYWSALQGDLTHVRMLERATDAPLPPVEIVDMSANRTSQGRRPLSPRLVAAIDRALRRGEKVMLFVNRRGYAGLLLCRACGFAPKCRRCAISLVVHTVDGSLRCHICGDAYKLIDKCPKCKRDGLRPFGFGTQRVEEEVRGLFPQARVVRMDSDTTSRRGAHARLLDDFGSEGDVLIGTQMIVKGLDFPTLTLVGVVSADIDLNRPDFRSAERTFALLTQVAGRAGRAAPGSSVIVQTYAPEHYSIQMAASHDYEKFAAKELGIRRELSYPPFGRLAYVGLAGVDAKAVERAAQWVRGQLTSRWPSLEILGPALDPLPKARGEYRMRLAIKTQDGDTLLDVCAEAQGLRPAEDARLSVVVDPR